MISYDATSVKNRLGEVIEAARQEPVCVTKSGKSVVYILSVAEYSRLQKLEDTYWSQKIIEAEKTGYVGSDKAMALIKDKMARLEDKPCQ